MSAKPVVASVLAVCTAPLLAQSGPPPIPAELRARFGFDGPLNVKVGDGIQGLRIADVDGDGKQEAIAIDARRARLAVVKVTGREAKLETIPTNGQIAGYAVADVHGDGVPDLLVVDPRGRLSVRHPGKEAEAPGIDLGLGGRGVELLTGDLDGDGKHDVVAHSRTHLRVVTRLHEAPQLSALEPMEENAYGFSLVDADGDGKLDLIGTVPGSSMGLRLRTGHGDGTFGSWRILAVDDLHGVGQAALADGSRALWTISGRTNRVALQRLQRSDAPGALDWWAFGENGGSKAMPFAVGDVDGDGDDDLVVATGDRAVLLVHEWRQDTFVPRTVPTLSGIASLALGDVDRDGKQDLVLVSPEEDALAWKSGAEPLERFPVQLTTVDKPLAAVAHPDGGVLVLGRTEKRDGHLHLVMPGKEPSKLADLGRLAADPGRLWIGDFGDAPGLEVAFVVPGEGLRTLTLGGETKKAKDKETAGFTKKLDDGAVTMTVRDGRPALVAVRDRFVRTFRIDALGQVQVLAQDNGPTGTGKLSLCAELPDGVRLYLDKEANKLVRVDGKGTPTSLDVPAFDFAALIAHRGGALLLGPRGLLRAPFAAGLSLHAVSVHEPPIERTAYSFARAGDFDHDGVADLLLVDRHLPGVQILAGGKDGLQRALAIPVFEAPPSEQPDTEPRELAVGDLDGDGRVDFVLIAHDRILIYPQEP